MSRHQYRHFFFVIIINGPNLVTIVYVSDVRVCECVRLDRMEKSVIYIFCFVSFPRPYASLLHTRASVWCNSETEMGKNLYILYRATLQTRT